MSCCPGLRIPSVNIPFCGYLTTQGEFTGTLRFFCQNRVLSGTRGGGAACLRR
ncbi:MULTISPECIES: hypothetical protein [unclassified Photorhabdus]|uniref:hypothetical protein n=1 Tax=unclassified Photorhabdus TaxID=2620880 RepID=UPI001313E6CB|nr:MULTISPECIES: hypothetical protein [unclassified Photorhabdus]